MDAAQDEARASRLLAGVVWALVSTSFLVIAQYLFFVGTDRLPFQLVRFILTVMMAIGLWQRVPAVRLVAIVLSGVAVVGSIYAAIGGAYEMAAFALPYGAVVHVLGFDPSVRRAFGLGPPLPEETRPDPDDHEPS